MLAADDGGIIGGIQPDHGGDEPAMLGLMSEEPIPTSMRTKKTGNL